MGMYACMHAHSLTPTSHLPPLTPHPSHPSSFTPLTLHTPHPSQEFWEFAAPLFHKAFPFTAAASPVDFYKTYNRVSAGCIRVEADEVTYPLHVILRYDIERKLFRNEMDVEQVHTHAHMHACTHDAHMVHT